MIKVLLTLSLLSPPSLPDCEEFASEAAKQSCREAIQSATNPAQRKEKAEKEKSKWSTESIEQAKAQRTAPRVAKGERAPRAPTGLSLSPRAHYKSLGNFHSTGERANFMREDLRLTRSAGGALVVWGVLSAVGIGLQVGSLRCDSISCTQKLGISAGVVGLAASTAMVGSIVQLVRLAKHRHRNF